MSVDVKFHIDIDGRRIDIEHQHQAGFSLQTLYFAALCITDCHT
jgi:hypothetical protein